MPQVEICNYCLGIYFATSSVALRCCALARIVASYLRFRDAKIIIPFGWFAATSNTTHHTPEHAGRLFHTQYLYRPSTLPTRSRSAFSSLNSNSKSVEVKDAVDGLCLRKAGTILDVVPAQPPAAAVCWRRCLRCPTHPTPSGRPGGISGFPRAWYRTVS